ncbi:MAG: SUMF1/EgtB/PvdO family nonheme iron enzyme [Verrucomicrobiales bacterium]|nr:SUMF1/EgtB/PvdO family nonheme iron enzyme [Verrucomicrobiales bacterium]
MRIKYPLRAHIKTVLILLLISGLSGGGGFAQTPTEETEPVFENSLKMAFVEVPETKVLFSIWETRVQDFRRFVNDTGSRWKPAGFAQGQTHPATMVSWEDATRFCRWLTKREAAAGTLPEGCRYRLPTSAEWSLAVGLKKPDANDTMAMVNGPSQTEFPWEDTWPPLEDAGNYHPELNCDSFSYTSPVGSFKPNRLGIYDLGGNVWEWCSDSFKNSIDFRVLRGASWRMRSPGDLLSSLEIGNVGHIQLNTYGFRVVLELAEGTVVKDLAVVDH